MISIEQKTRAYEALRASGFEPSVARELLAGSKGLRDEIAGKAMAALMTTTGACFGEAGDIHRAIVAAAAYQQADAMMKQRSEPT